eukprot:4740566-Pleurochrysis_carterae.AAC.2
MAGKLAQHRPCILFENSSPCNACFQAFPREELRIEDLPVEHPSCRHAVLLVGPHVHVDAVADAVALLVVRLVSAVVGLVGARAFLPRHVQRAVAVEEDAHAAAP